MNDGAGADGGQQLLRILREQDERGVLGRLFENLEQRVGRFFHKRRGGEDGEGARGLDRRTVIGDVNDLADLAQLDEQLRRVGRNDEHVGMGLDEDAGLALVGVAHIVAGLDGFGHQGFKIGGAGNAGAVGARAAEVGQAVGFGGIEAVDGLGQHQRQRVFARAARAGKDERMGKSLGANRLAEMGDGWRVAEKILEAHGLSLWHCADEMLRTVLILRSREQSAVFSRKNRKYDNKT